MQICRFCGKLIPTETRYDPGELWICKTCEEEHRKQNEKVAEILKERIEKLKEYICGEMPKRNGDRRTFLQKERELVRCKDCEHRPTKPDDYDPSASEEGFRLEFPDAVCPAQCEGDGYYSWYPSDNFFCGYGKRKEGADQ